MKHKKAYEKILRRYPSDFGGFGYRRLRGEWSRTDERELIDEWGCRWVKLIFGDIGQVKGHPLADWKRLETYEFPEVPDPHEKYVCRGGLWLFQRMWWLRGYENLLTDIVKERKDVILLRDRIIEWNVELVKRWLELGVDGVSFLDDWGTQNGLAINPSTWRRIFKPTYKKMFDVVHKGNAFVHFHSDGHILDIVPDLVQVGVDVLNLQLLVNDMEQLGEKYGGKICFVGGLDTQRILPRGSVKEVVNHARSVIRTFGCYDGGYIGRCNGVGHDVPTINVEAAYETFKKYGRYPLRNTPIRK